MRRDKHSAEQEKTQHALAVRAHKQSEHIKLKKKFLSTVQSGNHTWKTTMKCEELKNVYRALSGVTSKLKRDELREAIQELLNAL